MASILSRPQCVKGNLTWIVIDIIQMKMFENYTFEHTATSAGGQWVNKRVSQMREPLAACRELARD